MRRRDTGLTLPQILIVVTIVVILSALGLAAFGPQIRRQAHEGQIRRDLQAWVVALNIYKNDYDNLLPHGSMTLPRAGIVPARAPKSLVVPSPVGPVSGPPYLMTTSQRQINNEERQGRLIRWDQEKYPVVYLNYFSRTGGTRFADLLIPRAKSNWQVEGFELRTMRWRQDEFLSAYLSGRIGWSWNPSEYQLSSGMYNTFLGRQ